MTNIFFRKLVYIIIVSVGMSVGYDLNKHKICYYLGNTHLDTHWNWPVETTINQYLPNTLRENFKLFNKYPDYKFSFEGAYRYMLIKKHHPALYDSLRQYIAQERWFVAGSMLEACDVNIPSPEALIRQILYGNGFFEAEFGKKSVDIFLPDCFGFGLALPTVAVHCGLKGFYTQKLSWGVWKNPTNQTGGMGLWEGVDGSTLISPWSCTDTSYLVKQLGDATGVYASYNFTYIGDIGGAPSDASVAARQARINLNDTSFGPNSSFKIIYASSDQFFRDLTPAMISRFPKYKGELLLTSHGTGCYTSRPEMKVLNRKNELAANAAEASSVVANWLANKTYPTTDLKESWIRFLWHQFHDDLTGTSIPAVYAYSKPELDSTLSQFNSVIAKSLEAVSLSLDTKVQGIPLVVYNPLAFDREDIVDTIISFESGAPSYLRVFDKIGLETPSQEISRNGSKIRLPFLAKVPSMGYAVYDIRSSNTPCAIDSGLSVTSSSLSSKRYEVSIDANGDISTVYDKINQKHLLSAPARLALLPNNPSQWPQWEIPWSDISAMPRTYLSGPAMLQVVESGPVRVTLQVTRQVDSSTIVQLISLNAGGAGDVVEIKMNLNWKASNTLL
ncbi:MAG: alpha-mannosidase, partial [Fibrobacteres bacterium]|nr:alpha-mannosidase [Fibrobacterota bacterium]